MSNRGLPDAQQVREWIRLLDERDANLQAEIDPLLREQAANRDRRGLLADLLASYDDSGRVSEPDVAVDVTEAIGDRVRRQVRDVLGDAGGQMHINGIHAEFIKRGFDVPGLGRPANITAHLARSDDIVSPRRGYYALSALVGPIKKKSTRQRKTRTRGKQV